MCLTNINQKKKLDLFLLKFQEIKTNLPTKNKIKFKAIEEGTFYARDLVSEPGNVLHPDEYAKKIKFFEKGWFKISIYDNKK